MMRPGTSVTALGLRRDDTTGYPLKYDCQQSVMLRLGSSGVYNNSVGLPNSFVGFTRDRLIGSDQVDGRSTAFATNGCAHGISSARLRRNCHRSAGGRGSGRRGSGRGTPEVSRDFDRGDRTCGSGPQRRRS
jgi:hypothetical protein